MGRELLIVLGLAACGDNLHDLFPGLVQVSGSTPFDTSCVGTRQQGSNFPSMEVEPSLAVDPSHPGHLVGAWQQDRWSNGGSSGIGAAVSLDGGSSWSRSTPRVGRCAGGDLANGGDYDRATDPWVAIAPDGTVFLAALLFDSTSPRNAVVASRSVDGGLTWNDPTVLRFDDDPDAFNDKDSITADPGDAGRVYAVWDRTTGQTHPSDPTGTGPTWLARTTAGAWEPARIIFDPGADAQTIGNIIVVLPDGTLVNVFDLITSATRSPVYTISAIRSPDKGDTWSAPVAIGALRAVGVRDPFTLQGIRTGASLPTVAVDRRSGALYVAWETSHTDGNIDGIVLASSSDGGLTWSSPAFVNGAPDVAAFTPTLAVAPDGTVGVMYYDVRDSLPAAQTFRVTSWLATSRDGGQTWSEETIGQPFDLRPAHLVDVYFLGDYQGLGVSDGAFVPLFVAPGSDEDKTNVVVRAVR